MQEIIDKYQSLTEESLMQFLPGTGTDRHQLPQAMRYAVMNGGKRVRPMLVFAVGETLGLTPDQLITPAAAVEFIHCYSLIHDDLPAMDNDDLRRGQPTCHIEFDEATAILAGDALQALAFEIITSDVLFSSEQRLQMIETLSHACGHEGMAGGQALDLAAVNQTLTGKQLDRLHRLKTGALIKASILIGAIASKCPAQILPYLSEFADHIGLAFQIQDDVLDVVSSTETLGKQQGADSELNKPTYVSILGLEQAQKSYQHLFKLAKDCLAQAKLSTSPLASVLAYLAQRTF